MKIRAFFCAFLGVDLSEWIPLEELQKSGVPIMFVPKHMHPSSFVDMSKTKDNYLQNEDIEVAVNL
jgi:hypothetical protein